MGDDALTAEEISAITALWKQGVEIWDISKQLEFAPQLVVDVLESLDESAEQLRMEVESGELRVAMIGQWIVVDPVEDEEVEWDVDVGFLDPFAYVPREVLVRSLTVIEAAPGVTRAEHLDGRSFAVYGRDIDCDAIHDGLLDYWTTQFTSLLDTGEL